MSTYDVIAQQDGALTTDILLHPCGRFLRAYDSAAVQINLYTGYILKDVLRTHKMCCLPYYRLAHVMQLMPDFTFKIVDS